MARAKQPQVPESDEETFVPPFYEATETIFFHHPNGETAPVRAYNAGDRVEPGVVEAYKLGAQVKLPDVFEGQLASPAEHLPEPETTEAVPDTAGGE
jgi:hypothetical protein